MKSADKNTSVFPSMDLPHAETRKRKAGGPRSVAAAIDRKGWKRVRLGDVCKLCRGVRVVRSQLSQGRYLVYQNSLIPLGHYDKCNAPAKTTFVIAAGSAGEIGYCDEPFWAADDCFFLLPNESIISKFLYYSLTTQHQHISGLVRRGSVPRLARDIVGNLVLRLPNLSEQDEIVGALTSIDTHISALESLAAKYEAIKKATVNLLLQPETGWRQVKIKDFCPLQRGFDLPKHSRHRGVFPLVCSNGVSDRIDKYLVKAPGVVTGRSGTIGNVHFLGENFWPHNTTLWVSSFIDADPLFVFYLLSELGLSRFSGGSGVPTLNRNDVHDTLVEVPSIAGQHEIAEQIATIDKTISDCKAQLEKARQLKSGMMSYFFG